MDRDNNRSGEKLLQKNEVTESVWSRPHSWYTSHTVPQFSITRIFQSPLHTGYIPLLWKTAIMLPVPKKPSPKTLNDSSSSSNVYSIQVRRKIYPAVTSGGYLSMSRPSTICLQGKQKHGGCYPGPPQRHRQAPGKAEVVGTSTVSRLVKCVQHSC